MESELTTFNKRVYYAARDGMAMSLYTLLAERAREVITSLINKPVTVEDGQICTPLIAAARHGGEKVVKMLLEKFDTDIEQEGTIKFDGICIEGASALWCAASAGHLNIVKILVKRGADINHTTKSKSTPLRAACFEGRLDVVKYLLDHGADLNIANKFNNTCLMIAAYKGHTELVSFLLSSGANPNELPSCGNSALHFAAEAGHTQIVMELVQNGADVFKENSHGLTPLMSAAERACDSVVRYLLSVGSYTNSEFIDAYELLGASFANDRDHYCLTKAYEYLEMAMELRFQDPDDKIEKHLDKPIKAYENWIECRTVKELYAIRNNNNSLHMESLAIRERLLGTRNPELIHPIVYRGAVYADNDRFDRCLELWLHALKLRLDNYVSVSKDLLRFAQVFSQVLKLGQDLPFAHVLSVLEACRDELKRNKIKLYEQDCDEDIEEVVVEIESNISSTLYIITIMTKLLRSTKDHRDDLHKKRMIVRMADTIRKINKLGLALRNGQTLLHLAVNSETPVDDFHTNDICKYPCVDTTRLLLQCGSEINSMDLDRNTPLHVIVGYQKPISDFTSLHQIILLLQERGAHQDAVNGRGQSPLQACSTGVAEIILKTQRKISLQCLAARAIKFHCINYRGYVSRYLEEFIDLH